MKNLEEFAAHKLSKVQMNNIHGGTHWNCGVGGEHVAFVKANTQKEAEDYISGIYGESASCTKV